MSFYRYPLADVSYGREEITAVMDTLVSGRVTCGPRVAAFESHFAARMGAAPPVHAVMVNSGSSADLLLAFGLGPPTGDRDEVLVPAVTWPTQVWACVLAGYTVRLVDCDPATLQMDLHDLERKLTPRTRAVFAAHILGATGNVDWLVDAAERHRVPLLEDCCEALGTEWRGRHVGTFGDAGAFSFYFSHLLSTVEGGMVVVPRATVAETHRLRRAHGWQPVDTEYFRFPTWGLNLRPTEIQAAMGLVQLGRLGGFLEARRRNFAALTEAFRPFVPACFRPVAVLPQCRPAWHAFPVLVAPHAPFTKQELCAHLEEKGIETRPIVAGNLARQPAVAHHPKVLAGPLPGADAIHERGFYIGLSNHDDPEGTGYVGEVVAAWLRGRGNA